jgi:hypothetical protein
MSQFTGIQQGFYKPQNVGLPVSRRKSIPIEARVSVERQRAVLFLMESVEEKKSMFNCNNRLDHDGGCPSKD